MLCGEAPKNKLPSSKKRTLEEFYAKKHTMKDALRSHIIQRAGREPRQLDEVLDCFEEYRAKRGHHLLWAGDVCRHVYFIVQGCLQVYVVDKAGDESTRELYFEDQWTTDIFGFQNQTPSLENIKCAEPCLLLRISYDRFQQLSAQVPQFGAIYKQILEVSYNNTVYRLNTLMAMDALDRIRWVMEHRPGLLTRVSGRLVASYLGISPETMTRLKAKL